MSGLILKLSPHEELMINGVVVENGDRKTRLRIKTEGAHILRLRDALKPEDATTPLERAYYIAQRAVGGDMGRADAAAALNAALAKLSDAEAGGARESLAGHIAAGDFYRTMRALGALMAARRGKKTRPAPETGRLADA